MELTIIISGKSLICHLFISRCTLDSRGNSTVEVVSLANAAENRAIPRPLDEGIWIQPSPSPFIHACKSISLSYAPQETPMKHWETISCYPNNYSGVQRLDVAQRRIFGFDESGGETKYFESKKNEQQLRDKKARHASASLM